MTSHDPSTPAGVLTLARMRADIARVLQTPEDELDNADNLIDHGLDSIRLMSLAQQWQDAGAAVTFAELAEYPEIDHWWKLVASRRA